MIVYKVFVDDSVLGVFNFAARSSLFIYIYWMCTTLYFNNIKQVTRVSKDMANC